MDGQAAVRYVLKNNIEGVFLECGVGQGRFQHKWIQELMKHNKVRDIYLYDTFGGLTEPSEFDYTCEDAKIYKMTKEEVYKNWKTRIVSSTINKWCYWPLIYVQEQLYATGYPKENLHFVVGDVMETLKNKETIPNKIAILRLDTDWYESSKFELEQMYDNVTTGGVIIFDDYFHWDGQRRATDEFLQSRNLNYNIVNLGNNKSGAIIKK